jgi:hypothetical protein
MDFSGRDDGNLTEAGGTIPVVQLFQPLEWPDSGTRGSAFALTTMHGHFWRAKERYCWNAILRRRKAPAGISINAMMARLEGSGAGAMVDTPRKPLGLRVLPLI